MARSFEACNKINIGLIDLAVAAKNCVALTGEGLIFVLFGADAFVLQKVTVCACELLHNRRLLVDCLEDAVLVRSELLKFRLEELVLLAGCGLLVQDEDVADVVGVNLEMLAMFEPNVERFLTFSFKSLSTCCLSLFTSCNFLSNSSTRSI